MESRKAEYITWTIKEAMDALLEVAKRNGAVLPPDAVPDCLQFKGDVQNADGTRGVVTLTVVSQTAPRGVMTLVSKPGDA